MTLAYGLVMHEGRNRSWHDGFGPPFARSTRIEGRSSDRLEMTVHGVVGWKKALGFIRRPLTNATQGSEAAEGRAYRGKSLASGSRI